MEPQLAATPQILYNEPLMAGGRITAGGHAAIADLVAACLAVGAWVSFNTNTHREYVRIIVKKGGHEHEERYTKVAGVAVLALQVGDSFRTDDICIPRASPEYRNGPASAGDGLSSHGLRPQEVRPSTPTRAVTARQVGKSERNEYNALVALYGRVEATTIWMARDAKDTSLD